MYDESGKLNASAISVILIAVFLSIRFIVTRALAIIELYTETGTTVGKPIKFKEEGVGPTANLSVRSEDKRN